jgi:hypothetical protein
MEEGRRLQFLTPLSTPLIKSFNNMCLGDIVQKIINILTLGFGKRIAKKVANWLGFEDCGCSDRQRRLNEWSRCNKQIDISL